MVAAATRALVDTGTGACRAAVNLSGCGPGTHRDHSRPLENCPVARALLPSWSQAVQVAPRLHQGTHSQVNAALTSRRWTWQCQGASDTVIQTTAAQHNEPEP